MKRVIASAILLLAGLPSLDAQTAVDLPRSYALTNARIVAAPGRVIERGVVVVRDGKITAVAANATIPADAVKIDVAGKTLYPGLIDAASSVGLPANRPPTGFGGPPEGGPNAAPARNAPPPEIQPQRSAIDVFTPTEAELEALRNIGVTTVGLAFQGGIFPGQTAAVSTGTRALNLTGPGTPAIMGRPTGSDIAANDASSLVLRTPVALQVGFNPRRGTYPGTLMGTIAYVRQAFLDANYEIRAQSAFQRSPATAPRPQFDAQSRALGTAVTGSLPVWFVANRERDIKRTIELAGELNVRDYALLGVQEGWLALGDLRAARKPLLVTLDYPRASSITGRAYENHVKPASGEDRMGAQLDSTAARNARANAAALAKAGLTFALTGYGLATPADFRRNLVAAVDAGLSRDDALRALTTTPAQLLGLSGAVGTIEPGKLANLIAVEGDLFATQGKIREVFVEGRRYTVRETPAADSQRGGRNGARAPVVAGDWSGHVEVPNSGTTEFVLTLTVNGNQVRGALKLEGMAEAPLTGEVNGADVVLNGALTPPNGNSITISITARITGDDLKGTLSGQGIASRPFEARRQTQ